jgi:hypothetical protein
VLEATFAAVPFIVRLAVAWDQDWEMLWRAAGLVLGVDVLTPPFDTELPEGLALLVSSCGFGTDPRPSWRVRKIWYSCSGRHCAPEDAEVVELRIFNVESLLSDFAKLTGRAVPVNAEKRFVEALTKLHENA